MSIGHGLPYIDHYDEPDTVNRALRILTTGDFNPHWFGYPTVTIYLEAIVYVPVFVLLAAKGYAQGLSDIQYFDFFTHKGTWQWYINYSQFYLYGRLLVVLFGVATDLLVYFAAKKAFGDKKTALLAALFSACSYGMLFQSVHILPNIPVTFFITASALTSLYIAEPSPNGVSLRKLYLLNGFLIGLAAATKYNSFPVLIPFILAHLYRTRSLRLNRDIVLGLAFVFVGFLAGAPYSILDLPAFLNGLALVIKDYSQGRLNRAYTFSENLTNLNNYLQYYAFMYFFSILGMGLPILLAIAGSVQSAYKKNRKAIILLSFAVPYTLYMGSQKLFWPDGRNHVQVLPFIAVFAAYSMVSAIRWGLARNSRAAVHAFAIAAILIIAVFFRPVTMLAQDSYKRYGAIDTRVQAAEWVARELPPGSRLLVESNLNLMAEHFADDGLVVGEVDSFKEPDRLTDCEYFITGDFRFTDPWRTTAYTDVTLGRFKLIKEFSGSHINVEELPRPISDFNGPPCIRIYMRTQAG